MNEALVEKPAPRLAGVVGGLDRYFPILWIGLYLLLPVSGWAAEMFESWFDQQRDLEALRALLADGRADAIARSGIGPAYIGAAALIHELFRLSPEDSLIALTRASYVLSVAARLAPRSRRRHTPHARPADRFARHAARVRGTRLLGGDVVLVGRSLEPLLRSVPRG